MARTRPSIRSACRGRHTSRTQTQRESRSRAQGRTPLAAGRGSSAVGGARRRCASTGSSSPSRSSDGRRSLSPCACPVEGQAETCKRKATRQRPPLRNAERKRTRLGVARGRHTAVFHASWALGARICGQRFWSARCGCWQLDAARAVLVAEALCAMTGLERRGVAQGFACGLPSSFAAMARPPRNRRLRRIALGALVGARLVARARGRPARNWADGMGHAAWLALPFSGDEPVVEVPVVSPEGCIRASGARRASPWGDCPQSELRMCVSV